MKRTIVLILSIMLAGIAVFGFAACDKLQTFEGITLTSQTFFMTGTQNPFMRITFRTERPYLMTGTASRHPACMKCRRP